ACKLGLAQRALRLEEPSHLGADFVRLGVLLREAHALVPVWKPRCKVRWPLAARLRIDEIGHCDGPWSFEKRLDFGEEGFREAIDRVGESPPRLKELREKVG